MSNFQVHMMIMSAMVVSALAIISCNHSNDQVKNELNNSEDDLLI